MVYSKIAAEFKAAKALAPKHEAQLFRDMRINDKNVGYLINYGTKNELE